MPSDTDFTMVSTLVMPALSSTVINCLAITVSCPSALAASGDRLRETCSADSRRMKYSSQTSFVSCLFCPSTLASGGDMLREEHEGHSGSWQSLFLTK